MNDTPKGSILIVEDEVDLREILSEIMLMFGYTVHTAENGKAAVELLQKSNYDIDIVLCDINMPVMNGLQMLELIRHGGYNRPVIMLTGHGTRDESIKALRLGAFDFIDKPVDPERLKSVASEALRVSRSEQDLEDTLHQKLLSMSSVEKNSVYREELNTLIKVLEATGKSKKGA